MTDRTTPHVSTSAFAAAIRSRVHDRLKACGVANVPDIRVGTTAEAIISRAFVATLTRLIDQAAEHSRCMGAMTISALNIRTAIDAQFGDLVHAYGMLVPPDKVPKCNAVCIMGEEEDEAPSTDDMVDEKSEDAEEEEEEAERSDDGEEILEVDHVSEEEDEGSDSE